MPIVPEKGLVTFGVFQVNLAAHELRKHGVRVRLSGQPFAILSLLLERPGQVITREEIQRRLWPADTFVDFEQGLNGAIKKLRTALGDSPEQPRYVETLPRVGYRFIAPVSSNGATSPAQAPPTTSSAIATLPVISSTVEEPVRSFSARPLSSILAVLLAAVSVAFLFFYFRRTPVLLTNKDTIVLADFENSTNEPVFDDALHQGLLVGMEQSPFFQVLSDHQSAVILKQMGRSAEERLKGPAAIELCQRSGSKVAVQGTISSLGSNYLIALTAYRCDNAASIAHEQAQAKRKEEVLAALGLATTHLRTRLGESISSIQKYNVPIEQATTPSLDALKAYSVALSVSDREGDSASIPYYNRAIELDPDFAMAYGRLAGIYFNSGQSQLASENAGKAFAHADRTTESEKLLIESWYSIYSTGNLEKAAGYLELWKQNYPPSPRVLNDLGAVYGNLGRYEKASAIFRDSIRLDPTDAITYFNLATSLMALGRPEEADKVLAEAGNQKLQDNLLLEARYWIAFLRNDLPAMEQAVVLSSGDPGAHAVLLLEEANTATCSGKFAEARRLTEASATALQHDGAPESAAVAFAVAAAREAEIGETSPARDYIAKSLRLGRNSETLSLAALSSAQISDLSQAQSLLDELDKSHPADTLIQNYWLPVIRARIALHQGQWQKALDALEPTAPYEFAAPPGLTISVLYPAYVRGEAYLAAGDTTRAALQFQKLLDNPGMVLNFPLHSLAYLGLARAQLHSSDPANVAKSRDTYQTFLRLWQNADPNLALAKQAHTEFQHSLPQ